MNLCNTCSYHGVKLNFLILDRQKFLNIYFPTFGHMKCFKNVNYHLFNSFTRKITLSSL